MNKPLLIKTCLNCGSDQITKVCRDWQGNYRNQVYLVPQLEFYECPVCNERVFAPEAVAKMREYKTRKYIDAALAQQIIDKGAVIGVLTTGKISTPAKKLFAEANIAWA